MSPVLSAPRTLRPLFRSIPTSAPAFTIDLASPADREVIAHLRHEVYARELGQHHVNAEGRLEDALDAYNVHLVARVGDAIAGFVSLTPPDRPAYSIDKYFTRDALPFVVDSQLYEVRLLTVLRPHRGRELASLLMYAALRWVEAHGGTRIVAIGRREVVELYTRVGLRPVGLSTRSGAVTFDLMLATTAEIRARAVVHAEVLDRLEAHTDWRLPFAFRRPAACFHGGAFFDAIGPGFGRLDRRHEIVNADVLDAWFPPAPGVLATLEEHLPWLLRTSPPTGCEGLIAAIATARSVAPVNILPGAGSSDLIFRALRHWLTPASRSLILDPTYGEYAHVLEQVIGCRVDRLELHREDGYAADPARLEAALGRGYDLVVLVNPNSPTGRHLPREALELILAGAPAHTRIWIDETYVEYAATAAYSPPCEASAKQGRTGLNLASAPGHSPIPCSESLEQFAAQSENVVVCKSMSKVYALSGARVAYLCAGAAQLEALRAVTPPWVVGLPAQVAAVRALQDPAYYAARYAETHVFRADLAAGLRALGWDVLPGIANFLLCHLPPDGPDAATVVARCREQGVFLRNAATMSPRLGTHCVRLAVKDAESNHRILAALRSALA